MKGEYRGIVIRYARNNIKPFAVDDISGSYETIDKAESAIDRYIKKNRSIRRVPVFIGNSQFRETSGFVEAEITSITEEGEIWTVDKKNNRAKLYITSFCCETTDGNREIIKSYLAMLANAREIEKQAGELLKTVDCSSVVALIDKLKNT